MLDQQNFRTEVFKAMPLSHPHPKGLSICKDETSFLALVPCCRTYPSALPTSQRRRLRLQDVSRGVSKTGWRHDQDLTPDPSHLAQCPYLGVLFYRLLRMSEGMFWFSAYKWILAQEVQGPVTLRTRVCLGLALRVPHCSTEFPLL